MAAWKKLVPKFRSNKTSKSPTVMIGNEKSSRNATTNCIHTKTGRRKKVMPGARIMKMVVMKLTAPSNDATPSSRSPIAQKSIRTTSGWVESGAYPNQPPSGNPPRKNELDRKIDPERKVQ